MNTITEQSESQYRYNLVSNAKEYYRKTILPAPFSIFEYLVWLILGLIYICRNSTKKNKTTDIGEVSQDDTGNLEVEKQSRCLSVCEDFINLIGIPVWSKTFS